MPLWSIKIVHRSWQRALRPIGMGQKRMDRDHLFHMRKAFRGRMVGRSCFQTKQPHSGGGHSFIPSSSAHHLRLHSSQGHLSPQQPCLYGPRITARGSTRVPWIPGGRNACAQPTCPPHTNIHEHTCAAQDKEMIHEAAPASQAELNFSSLNYLAGH